MDSNTTDDHDIESMKKKIMDLLTILNQLDDKKKNLEDENIMLRRRINEIEMARIEKRAKAFDIFS